MQFQGVTAYINRHRRNERRFALRLALYETGRRREAPKHWEFSVRRERAEEIAIGLTFVLWAN